MKQDHKNEARQGYLSIHNRRNRSAQRDSGKEQQTRW